MESLRFLLVSTSDPSQRRSPSSIHVQALASELSKKGHEVHVEFSPARTRRKGRKSGRSRPRENGVRLHPIPGSWGAFQAFSAQAFGAAAGVGGFHEELIDTVRPDVVHLHDVSGLGMGVFARPDHGVALYTAHDYWIRCPRGDLFRYGREVCLAPTCVRCALVTKRPPQMWRGPAFGRALARLDAVIAPSGYMERALSSWVTCPIVRIPNFVPDGNSGGNVSEAEGYYAYSGDLSTEKGVAELALGFTHRRDLRLVIIGEGEHEDLLRDLVRRGLLNAQIEGEVDSKRREAIYGGANALIVPSLSPDNAPPAAIEALSWGCPILVSDRGGLPELLHDGATGRSFDPESRSILEAVDRFEDEDLASGLRAAARQAYVDHHRPATYIERYETLIKRWLDERRQDEEPPAAIPKEAMALPPPVDDDPWSSLL